MFRMNRAAGNEMGLVPPQILCDRQPARASVRSARIYSTLLIRAGQLSELVLVGQESGSKARMPSVWR
jgi:hypothetical protein